MRIYKGVGNVILVICIIIVVVGVGLFLFNKKPVIVVSGSMEPEIHVGSLCLIDKNDKAPDMNDIVLYHTEGKDIIHRVVDITDEGYITKGDANDVADFAPVTSSQVIGTCFFTIPYAGYAVSFVSSFQGIICIVAAGIIYVLIGLLLCPMKDNDKNEEKNSSQEIS